jgi:hypothetical protein
MSYPRAVTAQLLDFDASTVITGVLDQAFDIQFMDEMNGFGTGSCSLPISATDSNEVVRGRYVQILVAGTARFAFKIETTPQYSQIASGEEFDEILTATGRGWGCVTEEAIVYPETGLDLPLDYTYRLFSFASFYFANDGAWGPAQELYEYHDGVAYAVRVDSVLDTGADPEDPLDDVLTLYPAPIGFPWPLAEKNGPDGPAGEYIPTYWTIADGAAEDDVGYHFFRGTFLLSGSQATNFHVTADNLFTLFLNGVPILGEADDQMMWRGWKEVTLELPAGLYVVGAVVQNIDAPDIPYNPGGFLMDAVAISVYPGDIETSLTLALITSDSGWDSYFAEDEWPGWTPGQILTQLAEEAQARGALTQLNDMTWGDFGDSEGGDWDSSDPETTIEFIPTESFRVGQNLGDVLHQMTDEGWIDWHFRGDALDWDVWAQQTIGDVSGVSLQRGVNLLGLERGESSPYANALLVQYANGFTVVENATEITNYGTRVEDIYTTDAATIEEARRMGRVELRRRAIDGRAAVLVEVEPTSTTDCPYEGIVLGDYIDIPNQDEDGEDSMQVLSITCTQDEFGWAQWRLEVNARWRSPALERSQLLRTIGGKTMGSATDHGVAKD